jgi:hypothetical protein
MTGPQQPRLLCLCAAWCRLCDGYAPVFNGVVQALRQDWPALQARWVDIEDEADLIGDLDIETFPTLVLLLDSELRFAGPLTPQASTLERVVRSALDPTARPVQADAAWRAFVQRLCSADD